MKRTVIAAGIVILLTGSLLQSVGQSIVDTTTASKWYFGVKGGLLLATVWGPDQPSTSNGTVGSLIESILPGASAGFTLPIWFSKVFVLEPELLLSTKGVRWQLLDSSSVAGDTITWDIGRHFLHVEVPVLARLFLLKPQKRFRPVIYAGPQLSVNLYSYTEKEVNAGTSYSRNSWSLADSIPFVDVSGVAGLSLYIRAGRGYFIIDARGHAGFLNMGNGIENGEYPQVIHSLYAVGSVGYCFNPKRRKELW